MLWSEGEQANQLAVLVPMALCILHDTKSNPKQSSSPCLNSLSAHWLRAPFDSASKSRLSANFQRHRHCQDSVGRTFNWRWKMESAVRVEGTKNERRALRLTWVEGVESGGPWIVVFKRIECVKGGRKRRSLNLITERSFQRSHYVRMVKRAKSLRRRACHHGSKSQAGEWRKACQPSEHTDFLPPLWEALNYSGTCRPSWEEHYFLGDWWSLLINHKPWNV